MTAVCAHPFESDDIQLIMIVSRCADRFGLTMQSKEDESSLTAKAWRNLGASTRTSWWRMTLNIYVYLGSYIVVDSTSASEVLSKLSKSSSAYANFPRHC